MVSGVHLYLFSPTMMEVRTVAKIGILLSILATAATDEYCWTKNGRVLCPDDCCGPPGEEYCCHDDDHDDDDDDSDVEVGEVVGIVFGILATVCLLGALVVFYCCCRIKKERKGPVVSYHSNQIEATYRDPAAVGGIGMSQSTRMSYHNSGYQPTGMTSHHGVPLEAPPPYPGLRDNTYDTLDNVRDPGQYAQYDGANGAGKTQPMEVTRVENLPAAKTPNAPDYDNAFK